MGVNLCCPLRGQPLLPGVTTCPPEWTCAHPLRGTPPPAWTRRGVPGWRTPCPYPCPHPHLREGRHVHHVARVQVPLGVLFHVRHLQVLTPASRCFMMLSTCTQRSVSVLGTEGGPPLRGWACTEDAQLRAASATVKSTVLVLLGLRHCFWEQGPQGHWSCGAQSPGRDCGLGGIFLQSPASRSFRQSLGGSSLWVQCQGSMTPKLDPWT